MAMCLLRVVANHWLGAVPMEHFLSMNAAVKFKDRSWRLGPVVNYASCGWRPVRYIHMAVL